MKFSKKVLIGMFAFLILFVIANLIIFIVKGSVSDTLILSVFGMCGIEGGILGWIKTLDEKGKKNE